MDISNFPGHLLGLDYFHGKKPKTPLAQLEAMAQKYENLIFGPTLSACMSACLDLPKDFYCLSRSPLYALSETIKTPKGYCWHFLL